MRPLGIRHSLVQICHKEVMAQSMPAIQEFLEPQPLAMSRAGPAKLVNTVRGMFELHPSLSSVVWTSVTVTMRLQWTKTKMFSLTADLPDYAPGGFL